MPALATASTSASAFKAIVKTETKLFAREPGTLFWVMVFPPLLIIVFGLIPGYREANSQLDGRRIIDAYVPTTVLVALISAGLQAMPAALTGYRERGILRRMRTTPSRPIHLLVAQILLHAAAALLSALLVIVIGRLVYQVALPSQPIAYALTLFLAGLAAVSMGALITAVSRTAKVATAIGLSVFFPAMFASGVYVPIQVLPDTMRQVVELVPFGAAAQALYQSSAGDWPDGRHLVVLALWIVVLMATAARWFRWE